MMIILLYGPIELAVPSRWTIGERELLPLSSWQLTGYLRKQNVFDQLCYSIQYNRSLNVQQKRTALLLDKRSCVVELSAVYTRAEGKSDYDKRFIDNK